MITPPPPFEAPDNIKMTDDSFLSGQVSVRQTKDGYRIGTDAVILAASILSTGKSEHALDMGAGVGGVSLAVCERLEGLHITAVEKDPASHHLLCHNIATNDRKRTINAVLGDVLALPPALKGSFDQVFANPPFHHGSDAPSRSQRRRLAHYADDALLADWVASAFWAVKPKGRVTFITRADRTNQMMRAFDDNGAGELLLFPVWSSHGSPASRVILTARRSVKGSMAILPGLVLHQSDGALTPEARCVMKGEGLSLRHPATVHLQP